MPDQPHFYTARKSWLSSDNFTATAAAIQRFGTPRPYRRSWYTELDLNGFSFWTMGAPPQDSAVINRISTHYRSPLDALQPHFNSLFDNIPHFSSETSFIASRLNSLLASKQPLAILDIEPLNAWTLANLNLSPHSYTAITQSYRMLAAAAAAAPSQLNNLLLSSFDHFYPSSQFNLVIALWGSLATVTPAQLKKLRLIAPRARLFAMIPDPPSSWQRFGFTQVLQPKTALNSIAGLPSKRGTWLFYDAII